MVNVSWDDARAYVSWLSRTTGATYRLPTEAEWERAAAGSPTGCGDRVLAFLDGSGEGTCEVGTSGTNAAGLSDMVGNVWEWTSDCWEGDCGGRMVRGGSWRNDAEYLRPGARFWDLRRQPVQQQRFSRFEDAGLNPYSSALYILGPGHREAAVPGPTRQGPRAPGRAPLRARGAFSR